MLSPNGASRFHSHRLSRALGWYAERVNIAALSNSLRKNSNSSGLPISINVVLNSRSPQRSASLLSARFICGMRRVYEAQTHRRFGGMKNGVTTSRLIPTRHLSSGGRANRINSNLDGPVRLASPLQKGSLALSPSVYND